MKSIYVVDAVNFLFRSYYAIGPMTNLKGESTGGLYGFIRSIFKLIKDFSPTHFVAVFDGPQSTYHRKEIYSDYKIHRKAMPDDLYDQLEKAIQFCALAGIPSLSIPKVEADDVMGSIAKWGEQHETQVFLCTSDKDLCQLVSNHVSVINPHKGNLLMNREGVKEHFAVFPEQIVDLLALMGDSSDNIPGIEGIGPKTASQLLQEYGSLEGIFANVEKLGEKKRETILNGKESAYLSRALATIHTVVDFPKEEDFFLLKPPDLEKLKSFYHDMHFMTLLKELGPSDGEKTDYYLITNENELTDLIEKLAVAKEICVDTETTDINPMCAELVGIGVGIEPKLAWYIPFNGIIPPERCLQLLKPILENPSIKFFGHNLKYDLHVLRNHGIYIQNISFDTILASYLLAPHQPRHGLDHLSLSKFGKVKTPVTDLIGKGKKEISMKSVPLEKVAAYCCEDVDYTLRLKELFQKEIEEKGLKVVLETIELPLIPVLTEMEEKGVYLDTSKIKEMSLELGKEIQDLQSEIYKIADETFNLNSPKQLGHILFEKLQIPPPKKTKNESYSTSAEVLEMIEEASPIIPKIIGYRFFEKLRSTYVDSLPEQINPKTGRIHCTFNQSVTATGRLSCQDPNLQNIPVRSAEGRKLRTAFRPQFPNWSYLALDYSQIELRLLAHLSGDPVLTKAFQEGEDVHTYTASLVFNVTLNEVTPEMRHQAKAVNFGILYGQQAFGLAKELNISTKEAARLIETYFARYGKVKEYLETCKESVRKTGTSFTMTGRQRPIPDIYSNNPMVRAAAERLAVNTPLQGSQADLIKLAMIEIDKMLKQKHEEGYMVLQIHDELIFEVPDVRVESLAREIKKIMENIFVLKVPIIVDISIGKNWGEC